MALLSKPGLIPLQIESNGNLITTQVNKINFVGAVTGSVGNFNNVTIQIGIVPTASFAISSSYALVATTASYALTSTSASYASASTSASYAATASFVAGGASGFPYTGSAQITGSLGITGSFSQSGSANIFLQGLINQTTATTHVVTFNNATGQLFITASSAFGGGGGGGAPGGATNTIQFNNAGTFSGSGNFTLVGGNFVYLTGSLLVTGSSQFLGPVTGSSFTGSFTGSLFGTSSWASNAITASYIILAQTASFVTTAQTASYVILAQTASFVTTAQTASFVTTSQTASYVLQAVSASFANSSSTVYIASNGGTDANYTLVFKNSPGALDNYYQLAADGANGPYYNPSTNVLGGTGGITISGSIGRFNIITGSVSITGSLTGSLLGTSSFSTTASYALSAATFPYNGSAIISGSLGVTGSISQADDLGGLSITQEIINSSIPLGLTAVVTKTISGPASMFLDYQIVSGSNQRTGTIIANFNQFGTPTSTYYETVTADIGNTSVISFSTDGTPPYTIQANNSGLNPFTLKAILRYF